MAEQKDESLWDTQQVADYLKVDRETVYRWIKSGVLPCVRVQKLYRFQPSDIRALAERGVA